MPQSDHHLQYAGPGDTKPTLGQFNTSVDATVFSKIYMVCLIGKIVLEICLVPLIWLNILKSTNQNRECFSGGTTIKLIFCQSRNEVFSFDFINFESVIKCRTLFPIRVPDKNISVSSPGEKLIQVVIVICTADTVVVPTQAIDDAAITDVYHRNIWTFRDKSNTVLSTIRRRQRELWTNFNLRRSLLNLLKWRFGISAGRQIPASHFRLLNTKCDWVDTIVTECDPIRCTGVRLLLWRVRGDLFWLFRDVIHVQGLKAAPGSSDVPNKNLPTVTATRKNVIAVIRPSHSQHRVWKRLNMLILNMKLAASKPNLKQESFTLMVWTKLTIYPKSGKSAYWTNARGQSMPNL